MTPATTEETSLAEGIVYSRTAAVLRPPGQRHPAKSSAPMESHSISATDVMWTELLQDKTVL